MPEAPAAPPVAESPKPSGPNMSEALSGFDALLTTDTSTSADRLGETEPEAQPEPEPKQDTKPEVKTEPKPDTKPPEAKPETTEPKAKPATLRDALARSKTEAAEWKTKYEAAVAEAAKPKPDPEKEQLTKDREAWQKQREDLENELKFANYERTTEYKEKYQAPFLKAYEQGKTLTAAMSIKEPDKTDEFGEVTEAGKPRKATEADWDALMSITDEDAANKFIAERFGHNAARITVLRDKVMDLHGAMREAVEDFRKQAGTRDVQLRELTAKQQKETSDRWHQANSHAAEKFPQYFAPDPDDPKGNEMLATGTRLTDLAFGVLDAAEIPKLPPTVQAKLVNGKLPPAEMTLLHSAIRNRSAAYDRLTYRLAQRDADIAKLREQLSGYEKSEPGRGQARKAEVPGQKKGVPSTMDEINSAFDALAAGNG